MHSFQLGPFVFVYAQNRVSALREDRTERWGKMVHSWKEARLEASRWATNNFCQWIRDALELK